MLKPPYKGHMIKPVNNHLSKKLIFSDIAGRKESRFLLQKIYKIKQQFSILIDFIAITFYMIYLFSIDKKSALKGIFIC